MRALVASSHGPVEQLAIEAVPVPAPGPGQVLIRVRAAGINPFDVKLVAGQEGAIVSMQPPFIVGIDVAGTVVGTGDGVTDFVPGDEVIALTFPGGGIAEYVVANAGPAVARRPANLTAPVAAALPTPTLTAAAIAAASDVQAGQNVLVVGADGAVGSVLLQLLADTGVRILATAKPKTAERVRGLGAGEVIDYTAVDVAEQVLRLHPDGVDIAIDLANAGPGVGGTAALVAAGGQVISSLGGPTEFDRGVTARYLGAVDGFGRLQSVVDKVASGEIDVEVSTYPFEEAVTAMADFSGKRTTGRVVVTL